jgi:GTP-binding protein HflX
MLGSRAPRIVVFNKIDRLDEGRMVRLRAMYPDAVFVAAAREEGLDVLRDRVAQFFDRELRTVRLLFPYAHAAEMHRLRGLASDVHEEHTAEGIVFTARLPEAEAGRYDRYSIPDTETDTVRSTDPQNAEKGDEHGQTDDD